MVAYFFLPSPFGILSIIAGTFLLVRFQKIPGLGDLKLESSHKRMYFCLTCVYFLVLLVSAFARFSDASDACFSPLNDTLQRDGRRKRNLYKGVTFTRPSRPKTPFWAMRSLLFNRL
jgi:hypothetical protein